MSLQIFTTIYGEKLIVNVYRETSAVQDTKGSSKSFRKHETRHLSEHKVCLAYLCNIFLKLNIVKLMDQIFFRILPGVQGLVPMGGLLPLEVPTIQLNSLR